MLAVDCVMDLSARWPILLRLISAVSIGFTFSSCLTDTEVADVRFSYTDIAPSGYIDQSVELRLLSGGPLVPTVKYIALDGNGAEVSGIVVGTAFGSDRGLLVLAAPGYNDFLTFSGDRVAEVVDVRAELVSSVKSGDVPENFFAGVDVFWDDEAVDQFDVFDQVSLENTSDEPVALRVVCLNYDWPDEGHAQQAEEIAVVLDRVEVAAGEQKIVSVSKAFAVRSDRLGYGCGSLKAHLTP